MWEERTQVVKYKEARIIDDYQNRENRKFLLKDYNFVKLNLKDNIAVLIYNDKLILFTVKSEYYQITFNSLLNFNVQKNVFSNILIFVKDTFTFGNVN